MRIRVVTLDGRPAVLRAVTEWVAADERPRLADALASGQPFSLELRASPEAGGDVLRLQGAPPSEPDGELVVLIQDVTRSRRAADGARLLSAAGEALSGREDVEQALVDVERLAVDGFADWCAVLLARMPPREQHGLHRALEEELLRPLVPDSAERARLCGE